MKRLITILFCLLATSTALAESESMLWDQLSVRGYDSYNATQCYITPGTSFASCSYQDQYRTNCSASTHYGWISYTMDGRYSGSRYDGTIRTSSGGLVTKFYFVGQLNEDHGDYVVLQRFYYSAGATCEVRRKYGITFAVRSF